MNRTLAVIVCVLLAGLPAAEADSWLLPKKRTYCSANKQYCLEVTPRDLNSQLEYFQDKVSESEPAGVRRGDARVQCRGVLFRRRSFGRRQVIWDKPLTNEVAPVDVLVSDDGKAVVTLDNWHRMGYGENVVVFFGPDGQVLRQHSLEELLGDQVQHVTQSVSSRWWRDREELNNETGVLTIISALRTFETVNIGKIKVRKTGGWEKTELRPLRFDLRTGDLIPRARLERSPSSF